MAVTIIFKTTLSNGADHSALKKIGLCQTHGNIIPLSHGDDAANEALVTRLKKAFEHEPIAENENPGATAIATGAKDVMECVCLCTEYTSVLPPLAMHEEAPQ